MFDIIKSWFTDNNKSEELATQFDEDLHKILGEGDTPEKFMMYQKILVAQFAYNESLGMDYFDNIDSLYIAKMVLDELLAFHISGIHPVTADHKQTLFLHIDAETSGMDFCAKEVMVKRHVFDIAERKETNRNKNIAYDLAQNLNDELVKSVIDMAHKVDCQYKRTDKVVGAINEELLNFKEVSGYDATGMIVSSNVLGKLFNAGVVVRFDEPFSVGRGYIAIGNYDDEDGPMVVLNEKDETDSLLIGYHNSHLDTGIIFNPLILISAIDTITDDEKKIFRVSSGYAYTTSHQAEKLYRHVSFDF